MPLIPNAPFPVLFLSPRVPWPLDTGAKIRTHFLLRALCGSFQVDYAGFLQPDLAEDAARARLASCRSCRLLPEPLASPAGKALLACRTLIDSRPFAPIRYDHPALRAFVADWMLEHPEGLVHADHVHMAPYLSLGSPKARVIDEHNVEFLVLQRAAASHRRRPMRLWLLRQARRMLNFETRMVRAADLVLAVSHADADELASLAPDQRLQVIPNGVDPGYFSPPPSGSRRIPGRLVFTGSMDWLPNEDGMLHFLDEIWPRLPKTPGQPPWQLDIVGRRPSARLRSRATRSIRVTGDVPDVRPFLNEARILVVPLRIGGGSRLKILEAFASGVPVISTRVGCEGLKVEDRRHLLVADTPAEFAAAVGELHANESLARALSTAALGLARSDYVWESLGSRLVERYDRLMKEDLDAPAEELESPQPASVG